MSKEKWDGSNLQGLSFDYLTSVLMRMEQHGKTEATVRFGTLGEGVKPNYQIESNGGLFAYSSSNHELDVSHIAYESANLSDVVYTFDEVEANRSKMPKSEDAARKMCWDFWKLNGHMYPRLSPENWEKLVQEVMAGKPVKVAYEVLAASASKNNKGS